MKVNPKLHWLGDDGANRVITWQGKLLKHKVLYRPGVTSGGGKRGSVTDFSKASRSRMLQLIAAVDWEKARPVLFITLTYPDEVTDLDSKKLNLHRGLFVRYLEKWAEKKVPIVWRLEWKTRRSGKRKGQWMPHYHMLVFGIAFIDHRKTNEWWKKSLNCEGYVRTETKGMTGERQAGYYVSKYAAKVPDSPSLVNSAYLSKPTGRQWGVLRKELLPVFAEIQVRIRYTELLRMAVEMVKSEKPEWVISEDANFTLMGDIAMLVGELLFVDHDLLSDENVSDSQ